ncbi:MAG TPA: hypothetical protein VFI96_00355, partial [Longimicrobiaceae bacterium]|nr:hypothetical protein [Longimicrobiaceae bacterium]
LGLTRALAGSSATAIPEALQEEVGSKTEAYQLAFQKAYSHELSSRRRSAALAGGIAGTVLFIAAGTVAYTMMR